METKRATSHIYGTGYGSDHLWIRGDTRQVGSNDVHKATDYRCARCGEEFTHRYGMIPDVFVALQKWGVKEHCPVASVSSQSSHVKKTKGGPFVVPEDLRLRELILAGANGQLPGPDAESSVLAGDGRCGCVASNPHDTYFSAASTANAVRCGVCNGLV